MILRKTKKKKSKGKVKVGKKDSLNKPIYKDQRGEIHRLKLFGVKFNVVYTKAGAIRSGDYHSCIQYDLVLKGKCEFWLKKGKKTIKSVKGPAELIKIPANTPHLFKSLTDSVAIEFWSKPVDVKYYKPFRKLVEAQFKKKKPKKRKA